MILQRERSYKVFLLVADALAITMAFALAIVLRFYLAREFMETLGGKKGETPLVMYLKTFPYILIIWLVIFRFSGCYSLVISGVEELFAILKAVIFSVLISLALAFFYRHFEYSRPVLIIFVVATPILVILLRTAGRWLRDKIITHSKSLTRLVIVGANELGNTLAQEISRREVGYELVGFIDNRPTLSLPSPLEGEGKGEGCLLGQVDDLERLIHQQNINEVWIALPPRPGGAEEKKKLIEICLATKVSWKMVPDLYEVMLDWVKIDSLAGIPLIGMRRSNITGLNVWVKRVMDLIIIIPLLIITAPIMLLSVILIKITSAGPVLFRQKRIGKDEKRFVFFKFRTMYHDTNRTVHKDFTKQWIEGTVGVTDAERTTHNTQRTTVYKIKDDPRVTRVGRWLRRFSIDELPQFFSVLKGDMSLVGPRPALPYEIALYKEWHKRRLETKPGITGLWQVGGRNLLSFEEMVKLDIYYIENWSIGLDLKIIAKTVFAVVFSKAY